MILFETIVRRWYAFAFLAVFFWAASAERGWKRAVRFLAVAVVVSALAEYASTHYGLPYGYYRYIGATRGDELYLSNIPLFVPLTFGIVVWAGRAAAQAGLRARTPGRLILGGAGVATAIDLVIDPMTLRGHTWFLGRLYEYQAHKQVFAHAFPPPYRGGWFDVPWSNYAGWLLVAAIILWVDELFDAGEARTAEPLRGPTLAAAICAFFIVIALATRHWTIALASIGVTFALYAVSAANVRDLMDEAEPGPEPDAPG